MKLFDEDAMMNGAIFGHICFIVVILGVIVIGLFTL